jgi:serine/threonine protein kinase/Flp pilus assembly protein TadD
LLSGRLQAEESLAIVNDAGRVLAQSHSAGRILGNLTADCILLRNSQVTIDGFGGDNHTPDTPAAQDQPISDGPSSGIKVPAAQDTHIAQHAITDAHAVNVAAAGDSNYLAPELAAGDPPTVASDIYSFGRILEQIQSATILDPIRNSQWNAAISRCLDPVPSQRFPSVEGVLQAINEDDRTASLGTVTSIGESVKKWGQFQLLQRLDAGGFGEVYRAWDLTLEREVALKLLLPRGLRREEEFASIVAEARAMARVRHPNTVSVYGVDSHDGRVGLWSDFVRGQTLARWVESEGPRSEKESVQIGMALCDAMGAVHHAGLLHRDIKPGNAMRAEDGRILLMDFGLSHELYREARLGGTLGYMSPELLAGGSPSAQSDVYAMGMLLLFLVDGKVQTAKNNARASLQPGARSAFRQVIDTAIDADPQKRYSSAAELRNALAAVLTDSPSTPAGKKPLRSRIAWTAIALLLLCSLAFLVPQVRREMQARLAGTNRAAYQDYLAAEDALLRYDKPGNTQKAIGLFKQTLEQSPNFALAEAGLARADWRMYVDTSDKKWFDAASLSAANAAGMNPNLAPVQMTLGMIHLEKGNAALAAQELQQAQELDPRSADVHAAMGEAYRVQGRSPEAKNELQTAIDLAPDTWRWPYLLAALQIDSGDLKSAEANLKIALQNTPDNPRVLYNLGLVYRKQGRLAEAAQALQEALKLDSSYFQAAMALATVLTLQERYDSALEIYKQAVEMRPGDWRSWGSLATAQEFTGDDRGEAGRDYQKAVELAAPQLKITPDDPFLVSRLGRMYSSLHDPAHAAPLLRKSVILSPSNPEILERVAEGYELLGNREQALKLMDKALKLGFSLDYAKKTPVFKALRKDPRAPLQLRPDIVSAQNAHE